MAGHRPGRGCEVTAPGQQEPHGSPVTMAGAAGWPGMALSAARVSVSQGQVLVTGFPG
jgi:hypothetical protein